MFFSSKWIIYYIFFFVLFPLLSGILICPEFILHVVNKNNLLAKTDPQRLPTRGVLWGRAWGGYVRGFSKLTEAGSVLDVPSFY